MSQKNSILKLKNVTLVSVSSVLIDKTIFALEESMKNIDFYDVMLITHTLPKNLPEGIKFKQCNQLKNIDDYNKFVLYELHSYVESEFVILIQHDGYILKPNKWNDEFYNYDYIGAPWPKNLFFDKTNTNIRVGNGGFTLRSKKLLNVLNDLKLPFTDNGTGYFNEDGVLCNYYRTELISHGIKFAPPNIAAEFSHELDCDEDVLEPFGFHKYKK